MKANLFMDSLFLTPEKNLNKFCETTPKNKIPRCYLLWKDSKFPRREAERRRCIRLPEKFFKNFPERLPKLKTCEVIIYERENRRDIWKRFKGIFPK